MLRFNSRVSAIISDCKAAIFTLEDVVIHYALKGEWVYVPLSLRGI
jgi:hypothetical protein